MAEITDKNFKRLNFFRGFRTSEKDWNDGEQYHVEKRKLHNRMLHAPGIVPHALGGFKVSVRGRGELAVEIQPGYAVDGQGNDIFLWQPEIKQLNPVDFKLPATVYLVARYVEELTDFISYKENLDFKGHRRVSETAKLEWTMAEPDVNTEVELCRIALSKDVRRMTAAKSLLAPGVDEIDTRFAPIAGIAGSFLAPQQVWRLLETAAKSKRVYAYLFHQLQILPAADVLHAFITLEMLLHTQSVDLRNVFDLQFIVLQHQNTLIESIEANHPAISSQRDFANYKKHVEIAVKRFDERIFAAEFLDELLSYQTECVKFMNALFAKHLDSAPKVAERSTDSSAVVESIKVRSTAFTDQLSVEGTDLVLIDVLDPLDAESERNHAWRISGERDKYRTRQKLKYPDGVVVEDAGVAFEGGQLEFEVRNVEPGKDIYLIWRTDYVHGDWEAEVEGNDRRLKNAVCAGSDRKFRWRNWVYVVPAEHVREVAMRFKWKPVTADRDLNVFKMWAYQPAKRG